MQKSDTKAEVFVAETNFLTGILPDVFAEFSSLGTYLCVKKLRFSFPCTDFSVSLFRRLWKFLYGFSTPLNRCCWNIRCVPFTASGQFLMCNFLPDFFNIVKTCRGA